MKIVDRPVDIVNPEVAVEARDRAARLAAVNLAIRQNTTRRDTINGILDSEPARSVLASLTNAQQATATARGTAETAHSVASSASMAAAQFESNDLAAAETAFLNARRAVSVALAELLRDASTSVVGSLRRAVDSPTRCGRSPL